MNGYIYKVIAKFGRIQFNYLPFPQLYHFHFKMGRGFKGTNEEAAVESGLAK
jgi:hypothetical protein